MADVRVILYSQQGECLEVSNIKSIELDRDADAPCDGLRLTFYNDKPLGETVSAEVYMDSKKLFFGYVDIQREELMTQGRTSFIYARSSACILTDIEARPTTLYYPSAKAIYKLYIEKYGFSFDIDDVYGKGQYTVSKGTSLFGVLNNFIFSVTGKNIYVSPDNEIKLFDRGEDLYLSGNPFYEKKTINRGNALAYINYKVASADEYNRYYEDRKMSDKGINHLVVKNFSNIPSWQIEKKLSEIMQKANSDYMTYEVRYYDFIYANLFDIAHFRLALDGIYAGADVVAVTYVFNDNGVQTRLRLKINNDSEEINYVDK